MKEEEAYECQDLLGIFNERKRVLKIHNGQEFVAKNTCCPKIKGQRNPVWLANEIVYLNFAKSAQLRVPDAKLLNYKNELYFGSEFVSSRKDVQNSSTLKKLLDNKDNRIQLVRALLLDLALLNNDRTLKNVLFDASGNLWFIDHDKALWGDGKNPSDIPPGDLGRINSNTVHRKFTDYVGDYLASSEANTLIWNEEVWPIVRREIDALPLKIEILRGSQADVPNSWLSDDLWHQIEDFLPYWWCNLRCFFKHGNALNCIYNVLKKRQRIKDR